ncbi:MAG TPA: choice-of-anchor Q domain-containing protein [Rhodanobacteraceae bacterium]|nr:choice-of-anchor Q domain-containing protein [Rhodanobacteraceae bacterium]
MRTLFHTPLAIALSLAFAGPDDAAAMPGTVEAPSPSLHYALRMSQRAERNALRLPAHGAFRSLPHARGNVLPVTSCADDGGPGTLRSVIAGANEGDVVDLGALDCAAITLTQGIIDLSVLGDHHVNDLSIVGPGAAALTIDGNGDRVFAHGDFQIGLGTLSISDVTIANGNYTHGLASCIDSSGNIELTRAIVTGCNASGGGPLTFGGAVSAAYLTMTDSEIAYSNSSAAGDNVAIGGGAYVSGDATLIDSTITGNTARAETAGDGTYYLTAGGGLYVRGALAMTASTISNNRLYSNDIFRGPGGGAFVRAETSIVASTFSWNTAVTGGALTKAVFSHYGDPGTKLTITNSTFGVNGAMYLAGAIETFRPTTIASSTVFSNGSMYGGALFCRGSDVTLELESTMIALNAYSDVPGYILDIYCEENVTIAGANNLVTAARHVVLPPDTIDADPLIVGFVPADNGGPTETLAIDPASPAVDMGNNVLGLDFDQRGEGFARVSGAGPDIGAFEVQVAVPDGIFANGFD